MSTSISFSLVLNEHAGIQASILEENNRGRRENEPCMWSLARMKMRDGERGDLLGVLVMEWDHEGEWTWGLAFGLEEMREREEIGAEIVSWKEEENEWEMWLCCLKCGEMGQFS